jgi:hypothetical protein
LLATTLESISISLGLVALQEPLSNTIRAGR